MRLNKKCTPIFSPTPTQASRISLGCYELAERRTSYLDVVKVEYMSAVNSLDLYVGVADAAFLARDACR